MSTRKNSPFLSVLAVALGLLLSACGTGGDDGGSGETSTETEPTTTETTEDGTEEDTEDASGDLTSVTVTTIPILDAAAFIWAQEEGLFEAEGLAVEDVTSAGGALGIPAMVGGDVDMVFSNTISVILAASEGLPVQIVVQTNESTPASESAEDFVAIVADPDSGVASPADLAGKRMAVNTLNNINWLFERSWLRSNNVDPDSVEFVEIPFPNQPAAVLEGEVAATMIGAPFLQQLKSEGAQVLGYPYHALERVSVAHFVATSEFVEANPDVVAGFQAAMEEAARQIQDPANRDRFVEVMAERTGIGADLLEEAILPVYETSPDPQVIQEMGELMVEEGLIESVPDLSGILPSGS